MYYFGSIAYMAAIASFVYFAYTNYNQAVSTAFISLDEGSGICNTVSIPITNTYLADSAGNWQGSPAFTYSRAMYSLTLNAFQVESTAQYVDMMETFQQSLQYIGQVMRGQDLALNMIYWIGYVKYYSVQYPTATNFSDIGYGNLQYLQLTGDALQIFDLSYLQARMASVSGTCHVASFTAYDRSDGLLMLHMNSTEFVHDDICMDTVLPQNIGYVAVLDDTNFNIPLEVRSFSIAVAVNVGIMDVSNLGAAGYSILPFEYQSVNYTFGQYFDIRYPTMKTVYCIVNQSAVPPPAEDGTLQGIKQLCFYALGNTLGLPVINSFGNSSANPVRCDCTKPVGYSSYCNIVNLIPSLVFYKYDGTVQYDLTDIKKTMQQLGLFNLLKLYFNYPSYEDLNVAAYEATFAAVAEAYGKMDPLLKTSSWLKNAYKFCSIGKQTCSILAYNVYSPEEHSISTYKYQLLNGSCTDSITISNTDW